MRINQITITIERFGEAAPDGERQKLSIYADSHDIYAALCSAFYGALRFLNVSGLALPPDGALDVRDITKGYPWERPAPESSE